MGSCSFWSGTNALSCARCSLAFRARSRNFLSDAFGSNRRASGAGPRSWSPARCRCGRPGRLRAAISIDGVYRGLDLRSPAIVSGPVTWLPGPGPTRSASGKLVFVGYQLVFTRARLFFVCKPLLELQDPRIFVWYPHVYLPDLLFGFRGPLCFPRGSLPFVRDLLPVGRNSRLSSPGRPPDPFRARRLESDDRGPRPAYPGSVRR
jgi:hypothetical protein